MTRSWGGACQLCRVVFTPPEEVKISPVTSYQGDLKEIITGPPEFVYFSNESVQSHEKPHNEPASPIICPVP